MNVKNEMPYEVLCQELISKVQNELSRVDKDIENLLKMRIDLRIEVKKYKDILFDYKERQNKITMTRKN